MHVFAQYDILFNVSLLVPHQQPPPPEVMDEKERAKLKKAVMLMTDKDKVTKDSIVQRAFRKVFLERRLLHVRVNGA